jgi:hypothetical protein
VSGAFIQALSAHRALIVDNETVSRHGHRQPGVDLSEQPAGVERTVTDNSASGRRCNTTVFSSRSFPSGPQEVMIAITAVTYLTVWGDCAGEGRLMATHSFGPRPGASSSSYAESPAWSHSYSVAALRAGLIALALLAVLAILVLA